MAAGVAGLGSVATGPAGVTAGSPNASLGTLFCTSDRAPMNRTETPRQLRIATEKTAVFRIEKREMRETDLAR